MTRSFIDRMSQRYGCVLPTRRLRPSRTTTGVTTTGWAALPCSLWTSEELSRVPRRSVLLLDTWLQGSPSVIRSLIFDAIDESSEKSQIEDIIASHRRKT
eukprot:scaffold347356_cov16-Prasinocladus_malaysianus.AAC.1